MPGKFRREFSQGLSFGCLSLVFVACSQVAPPARMGLRWRTSTLESGFRLSDYGKIPKLGMAADAEEMKPLLEKNGSLQQGVISAPTKIVVVGAEQISCPLSAGTPVYVVGVRGEHLLVDLTAPCVTGNQRMSEGYVPISHVNPVDASASRPGTEGFPGTSSSRPGTEGFPGTSSSRPGTEGFPGSTSSSRPGTEGFPGSTSSARPGTEGFPGSSSARPGTEGVPTSGGQTAGGLPNGRSGLENVPANGGQTAGGFPNGRSGMENVPANGGQTAGGLPNGRSGMEDVPTTGSSRPSERPVPELPPNLTGCQGISQILMHGVKVSVSKGQFSDDYLSKQFQVSSGFDEGGCTGVFGLSPTYAEIPLETVAKHKALCAIPGDVFRRGGITDDGVPLALLVKGSAASWRVSVFSLGAEKYAGPLDANLDMKPVVTVIKGAEHYNPEKGTTLIPLAEILKTQQFNGGEGTPVVFEVLGIDRNSAPIGPQCLHKIQVVSPIVLDLTGQGGLKILPLSAESVRFDLNADGIPEPTAWISSDAGFLAVDRNGNGRIDSGRELFGEETILPDGAKAKDGYAAMAGFDSDRNGFLDEHDPIFKKLLLWRDLNGNGISEKQELFSLEQAHITRISVSAAASQFNDISRKKSLGLGSRIPFESRFWGPDFCGSAGCFSYDVYFATQK